MERKLETILLISISILALTMIWLYVTVKPMHETNDNRSMNVSQNITSLMNIEYAQVNGKSLLLDIYLPNNKTNNSPLIIFIHGGGWMQGNKENCPGNAIAQRKYVVACINYRLSGISKFPAQIHDVKAAIRWLRANANIYNIDPNRIGVFGDSAGGHLAALAGTSGGLWFGDNPKLSEYSDRVQAVAEWFGPVDMIAVENITKTGADYYEYYRAATQLIGGPIIQNHDKANAANPVIYITPEDPPFLIIHGTSDNIVPTEQSKIFYYELQKSGVYAELIINNGGHGYQLDESGAEFRKTMDFFDSQLKK